MKVKELIAELQQLNPEANIWVLYDSFFAYPPDFEEATEHMVTTSGGKIQLGDYVHET